MKNKWTLVATLPKHPNDFFLVDCGDGITFALHPQITKPGQIPNYAEGQRLIKLAAAAPELYEELEEAITHIQTWMNSGYMDIQTADRNIARARAALAKARGESPDAT